MKDFMAVVFKMLLVRKNEFADYWSTRQSMNTLWFRLKFSLDHFRKIMGVFHNVDKTIIPAMDDSSYRASVILRLQLDYRNRITFVCTISFLCPKQSSWSFQA